MTGTKKSANTEISHKRKPPKSAWKPGQSGNPKGAPKRGESWAETIKKIGELDGPEIASLWDTQHKEFAKLPEGITMKQLVVMTVYAALLREPSPGNWRELMERADGKVKDQVELSGDEEKPITIRIVRASAVATDSDQ
jgi:hypothetical protein